MREDLIERLRLAAKILCDIGGQSAMADTIAEAAAALEAAREDAERLEWLAANHNMIVKCRALWFSSDGGGIYQDSTLRGAIDQARGKGIVPEQGEGE